MIICSNYMFSINKSVIYNLGGNFRIIPLSMVNNISVYSRDGRHKCNDNILILT